MFPVKVKLNVSKTFLHWEVPYRTGSLAYIMELMTSAG